jgi:hypothetical protein
MPNVASIEIALLWPHFNMHRNCHGVWIFKVKGRSTFIFILSKDSFFQFSKAHILTLNASFLYDAKCAFLSYIHNFEHLINQGNHLLSWTHNVVGATTTFVYVVCKLQCAQPISKHKTTQALNLLLIYGAYWDLLTFDSRPIGLWARVPSSLVWSTC